MPTFKTDVIFFKACDQEKVYGSPASSLAAIEPPLWDALFAAQFRKQVFNIAIIDAEAGNLSPEDVVAKTIFFAYNYIFRGKKRFSQLLLLDPSNKYRFDFLPIYKMLSDPNHLVNCINGGCEK